MPYFEVNVTKQDWIIGFPPRETEPSNVIRVKCSISSPELDLSAFASLRKALTLSLRMDTPEVDRILNPTHDSNASKTDPTDWGLASIQAVTRRISRETTNFCSHIENVAKMVAKAFQKNNISEVIFEHAEWLDLATIRVISSHGRGRSQNNIQYKLKFSEAPDSVTLHQCRSFTVCRAQIWNKFVNTTTVTLTDKHISLTPLVTSDNSSLFESEAHFFKNVARAISDITYDYAILCCRNACIQFAGTETAASAKMIWATIECNVGRINKALKLGHFALEDAKSAVLRSRIYYLIGLINAKRLGDLDEAKNNFEQGKSLALGNENSDDNDAEKKFEASWHENGLALLQVMQAVRVDKDEMQKFLDCALSLEKSALSRITPLSGPEIDYLKYNLAANIIFLLEIGGHFSEALDLFSSIFSGLILTENPVAPEISMTVYYRMGLLQFKSGDQEGAFDSLRKALNLSKQSQNAYSGARVQYALAHYYFEAGLQEDALIHFTELSQMVDESLDTQLATDALGLVRYWQESLSDSSFGMTALEKLLSVKADFGGEHGPHSTHKPKISPKLPAYNSLVDLLPTPGGDLNKRFSASSFKGHSSVRPKNIDLVL